MSKKIILTLTISFITVFSLMGSVEGDKRHIAADTLNVFGNTIDKVTRAIIPSANVEVIDLNNDSVIRSTFTDDLGYFSLDIVIDDTVALKVSHLGYNTAQSIILPRSSNEIPVILK